MALPISLPLPIPTHTSRPLSPDGKRVLAIALAVSLGLHLAITLWPVETPDVSEATVLTATITEMPPPPVPSAVPPVAKAKPKPRRPAPAVPTPEPVADPVPEPPAEVAVIESPAPAAPAPAEAPPALAEEIAPVTIVAPPPSIRTLPARVDLAYRVYYGPGLYIGDATYRFEHASNRYRISTVGEARGLAALVLRGQGKVEVSGLITPAGLQPWELVVERGSRDRREAATFDWESGIATLHEEKTAALELPSFDPLSVMWHFYFAPPLESEQVLHIVTTRRIVRVTVRREGTETVSWPHGEVEAERWHRTSDDGRTESIVWLAPSLRYLPIKMRVTNTRRGTVEVVLASIRVDDQAPLE